ncbi:MAG TPA: ThiF family adenylyltransferase [Candidatus Cloacimonas acidaminovorans]|nr:ThiF family adenylyltransferase [Candidatus Cloacimonas acidaminovorans]
MKERYKRQLDIVNPELLGLPIHIIGCGGIGSWTALVLAKMGCNNISVYDDDIVEDHNVASQFFKESQLEMKKVDALSENVLEQSGIRLSRHENKDEELIGVEPTEDAELVILALDSMAERIRLGELYKDRNLYIIDGRMGGTQVEIYTRKASEYLGTTVDPETIVPDICTARSICFNCVTIGGLIGNFVRMFANKNISNNDIVFGLDNMILLK